MKLGDFKLVKKDTGSTTFDQVIEEFNKTSSPYPSESSIPALFKEQVALHPTKTAVTLQNASITYEALDKRSDELAQFIYAKIQQENIVGVLLEKSIDTIVSILAILKAGGAYMALPETYPFERVKLMVDEAKCPLLITGKSYIKRANKLQWDCNTLTHVVCIDSTNYNAEMETENELMKKDLWDYVGENAHDDISGGGWINSYTGEELSREVMDEYGDNILQKITPLVNENSKILEIACASGISMFRIAPKVKLYYGTDLSSEILAKTELERQERGMDNITLQCLPAHEVDHVSEKGFDLIILNSVIQCFNGHNYLKDVLQKCLNLLNDEGKIFIGDIQDQDLKDELITSLIEFKQNNVGKNYTTKTDWSNEVFISRDFLNDLMVEKDEIASVEYSHKIGTTKSELSDFRYDAIITVDKKNAQKTTLECTKYQYDLSHIKQTASKPLPELTSSHLAYVMFTSGSTGRPKGVLAEHKGVVRLIKNTNYLQIQSDDVVSQTGPLSFDASTFEIWGTLLNGATLSLIPRNTLLSPEEFSQHLQKHGITVLWLTTAIFAHFTEHDATMFNPVHQLVTGGEVMPPASMKKLREVNPHIRMWNVYGPTENTTFTTGYEAKNEIPPVVPIGKPISNTQCYILDKALNPQPIGIVGDLYTAGDGLAREYLGDKALTDQKFIANPFQKGTRMYYTGDRAKWTKDGDIHFMGREDNQVKVRGFRIELGEIEAHLNHVAGVKECTVLLREDDRGDKTLAAYFTADYDLAIDDIREDLQLRLPNHQIPAYFVQLDEFPLNANGKIDKKKLPDPVIKSSETYKAPENDIQKTLANIWAELLQINQVGIHDNFFKIGGHSLKATQLVSMVYKALGIELKLREIFASPTIYELSEIIQLRNPDSFLAIERIPESDAYDVSHSQRRLWVIYNVNKENTAYNMPSTFELNGSLDLDVLEKTLNLVVQRHESLRTTFITLNGEPKQHVNKNIQIELKRFKGEKDTNTFNARHYIPFDLEKGPLIRTQILTLSDEKHLFGITLHHIISDGWSMKVLFSEIIQAYHALVKGNTPELPALPMQYRDFAAWQNDLLSDSNTQSDRKYWENTLSGTIPVLELPTDYPRPPVQTFDGAAHSFRLDKPTVDKLRGLCENNETTLFMALLTIVKILLHKYSGQEDIIVGSPIAGRSHDDLKNQIGFYVNTLALRDHVHKNEHFKSILGHVKQTTLDAYEHQSYPFDKLVEDIDIERDISRNPLFDVIVGMVNFDMAEGVASDESSSLSYQPALSEGHNSMVDLTFNFFDGDEVHVDLTYRTHLFKKETIERLAHHFIALTNEIIQHPDKSIGKLHWSTEKERNEIASFSKGKEVAIPSGSLPELFSNIAQQHGSNNAVQFGNESISYTELSTMTDQVASYLQSKGVEKGSKVVFAAEKSLHTVAWIMGILRTGAIYVPVDASYPEQRIRQIVEQSGSDYILTDIPAFQGDKTTINLAPESFESNIPENLPDFPKATDPAYIIHTSGSTGKPKGVLLHHSGLINMALDQIDTFSITPKDHLLQFASLSFDASLYELFMALLSGATIHLIGNDVKNNTNAFEAYLTTHNITVATLPPVYLSTLKKERLTSLRVLITAGDAARAEDINQLPANIEYVNAYGPTEASVCVSNFIVGKQRNLSAIPIGKPLRNTQLYVLDQELQRCPIGVKGDVYIAGAGVALGYVNEEVLTQQSFISNPYEEGLMYKTGDIASWSADGNLVFTGRSDHQLKIRGHRVELGEIEHFIRSCNDINDVVVIADILVGKEKDLIAYIVPFEAYDESRFRKTLNQGLPSYLVPGHIVTLEALPLTTNGKIDTEKLPKPTLQDENTYHAPQNEVQELLVSLWQNLLGVHKIGIRDNFFRLGGDSIKAIQLVSKLAEADYHLDIQTLYQNQYIEELATALTQKQEIANQDAVVGEITPSPIQQWFLEQNKLNKDHFNQTIMLFSEQSLDLEALQNTFIQLVNHHDVLRLSKTADFSLHHDAERSTFDIATYDFRGKNNAPTLLEEQMEQNHKSIQLAKNRLMNVSLIRMDDGDRLHVVIHHLMIDGVSWRILFEDFSSLYDHYTSSKENYKLPAKSHSYQEWTKSLQEYAQEEVLSEVPFWSEQTNKAHSALPVDHSSAATTFETNAQVGFTLSKEETSALLLSVQGHYDAEINSILLAGLSSALHQKWSDLRSIAVDLEGHGREPITNLNISRTVGWFTSVYPISLPLNRNENVRNIHQTLSEIPNKGIGYGILKYLSPKDNVSKINFNVEPEISFNYLGQFNDTVGSDEHAMRLEHSGNPVDSSSKRLYKLDVSGMITGNQLSLSITYSRNEYDESTIKALTDAYKAALVNMIEMATQPSSSEGKVSITALHEPVSTSKSVFFVPNTIGDPHVYDQIASAFSDDTEALSFDWTDGFSSIEKVANACVAQMKARPSEGIITIVGHSMGALIAFEMAKLLEAQQRKVKLVLIDQEPVKANVMDANTVSHVDQYIDHVVSLQPAEEQAALRKRMRQHYQWVNVYESTGKLQASITAFKALDGNPPQQMDKWSDLTTSNVLIVDINGDHGSCLSLGAKEVGRFIN